MGLYTEWIPPSSSDVRDEGKKINGQLVDSDRLNDELHVHFGSAECPHMFQALILIPVDLWLPCVLN